MCYISALCVRSGVYLYFLRNVWCVYFNKFFLNSAKNEANTLHFVSYQTQKYLVITFLCSKSKFLLSSALNNQWHSHKLQPCLACLHYLCTLLNSWLYIALWQPFQYADVMSNLRSVIHSYTGRKEVHFTNIILIRLVTELWSR